MSCISHLWGELAKPGLSPGWPSCAQGFPAGGQPFTRTVILNQFWQWQTVCQSELFSKPGLRSPLASERQAHRVSGHLLWNSVEVSQLTSHQLVPHSQMSLSRAEGRSSWVLLPSAQLSPAKLLKQLLTSSFRGCWCRRLTPCTCLFEGFVFSSSNKPNYDFPVLSLAFLPPCFAFLQSYSLLQLLFHRLWSIRLQNWFKLKVVENCDRAFCRISKVRNGARTLISRTHVEKLHNVEETTHLHY